MSRWTLDEGVCVRMGVAAALRRGALLSSVVGVATLWGCAAEQQRPRAEAPASLSRPVEPAPPFALGGEVGLELRRWVYRLESGALRRALAESAEPAPLSEEAASALAKLGLTLLRTPRAQLLSLRDSLGALARAERVWIAQSPSWRPLLVSPTPATRTLTEGRVVDTPRGRPALLVRTWVAPAREGPVVRLDMLAVDGLVGPAPPLASLVEQDHGVERLAASPLAGAVVSLALEPGWVYLLAADPAAAQEGASEGSVRRAPSKTRQQGGGAPEPLTSWPLPQAARREQTGPVTPMPASVGALLLTVRDEQAATEGDAQGRSVVVALLPRTGTTVRVAP